MGFVRTKFYFQVIATLLCVKKTKMKLPGIVFGTDDKSRSYEINRLVKEDKFSRTDQY
jgi:hypothetical protein